MDTQPLRQNYPTYKTTENYESSMIRMEIMPNACDKVTTCPLLIKNNAEGFDNSFVNDSDNESSNAEMVQTNSNSNQPNNDKPSNSTLLFIAFASFLIFSVVQLFAAIMGHSQAMLSDSASMIVDSMTYGFNYCAEKKKVGASPRKRLMLELFPPLISVTTLVTVTFFIIKDALKTLMGNPADDDEEPNVILMSTFSAVNILVDVLNVFCFAKADHAFGYTASPPDIELFSDKPNEEQNQTLYPSATINNAGSQERSSWLVVSNPGPNNRYQQLSSEENEEVHDGNLNMCSAYTHVFADTLRSIAVFIAAGIALCVKSVTPGAADAVAAIIVSVILIITLIPLCKGLIYTWVELQDLGKQEEMMIKVAKSVSVSSRKSINVPSENV